MYFYGVLEVIWLIIEFIYIKICILINSDKVFGFIEYVFVFLFEFWDFLCVDQWVIGVVYVVKIVCLVIKKYELID